MAKAQTPKVSVIIPNYNHATYLRQRIDSVLAQTFQDFEVILLDDASTDESRTILQEYTKDPRVRLDFNERNSGSTFKQWNKGVRLARGEYIWIAESDDYADEHLLEQLVSRLDGQPKAAFAYCRSWRVCNGHADALADDYLEAIDHTHWKTDFVADGREECEKYFVHTNPVPNASAVVFRKATFEKAGGADENLHLCGDWKLWAGMALRGKIAYVAEPLNYYRSHDSSVSKASRDAGVWAREGRQVAEWIHKETHFWTISVPLLMSSRTSLRTKREIVRKGWDLDPHPTRNALAPAMLAVRLKFLRQWRAIASALRTAKNTPGLRRVIARGAMPATAPKDWFSGMGDETWFWINTTGRRRRKEVAPLVPKMPAISMQERYTGSSEDQTLEEGFKAYRLFKKIYETHVGPIESARGVLDFGCGWGRIIRFFLKDVAPERLFGVDHSGEAIQACRETNKWCKFMLIGAHPPTPLTAESFDLIYLYSVFSHLPEEMHWSLLKEFERLLVPGGILIATTRARDFIYLCQNLRKDPQLNEQPDWLKTSALAFEDADAAIAQYDEGHFTYASLRHSDPRWSFWGEACIPKAYVERRWKEIFEVCDYVDDRNVCPQNVIVARKRLPMSVAMTAPRITTGAELRASAPETL